MAEYDSSHIEVLKWNEAIQKRPGMYFQECFDEKNLNSLPIEAACHAFDEVIEGQCTEIKILIGSEWFEVRYNVGMPLDEAEDGTVAAECMLTRLYACSNFKKNLKVGDEFCTVGLATINAVSIEAELVTIENGQIFEVLFSKGLVVERKEIEPIAFEDLTQMRFWLNFALFEGLSFSYDGVVSKVNALPNELKSLIKVERANNAFKQTARSERRLK